MEKYIVYKHETPNGKVYVGITRNAVDKRWRNGKGYKYNKHFYGAIKKYGWDNIKHEIIATNQSEENAKEMERFFIQLYKSYDSEYGYNKTLGGDSISCARERAILQYDLNGELIKKYNTLTEASRITKTNISKISSCACGNRLTTNGYIWVFEDDNRKTIKIHEKIKEKKHSSKMCGGANHQARAIEQYSLSGEYIKTFSSAQDAANELGIDYSTIKGCASNNKNSKSAGGYIWIHADEPNKQFLLDERMNKGCEREVSQYSLDGKYIRDFASITEASLNFKPKARHIGDVCRGKRKSSCGYIWKFKEAVLES